MKHLVIDWENGDQSAVEFLGWRSDRGAFFATGPGDRPLMFELCAACPSKSESGEGYQLPLLVPLRIKPRRFEADWKEEELESLREWLNFELARLEEVPDADLFLLRKEGRAEQEIRQAREDCRAHAFRRFCRAKEGPLALLVWLALTPHDYDSIIDSEFGDRLGDENFNSLKEEIFRFVTCCGSIVDSVGVPEHAAAQLVLSLKGVRYVLEAEGGSIFYLNGVRDRPFLKEADVESYLRFRSLKARASTSAREIVKVQDEFPFKEVCKELGCKAHTLRTYCKLIGCDPHQISKTDFVAIQKLRKDMTKRPQLRRKPGSGRSRADV